MTASNGIALSDFGSFHVGGRILKVSGAQIQHVAISEALPNYARDPNGRYAVEAAYVSYAIPSIITADPVLLIHGGGMCGTVWETTPDGRPGWQRLLLERGHPVYVIDMVERGRAGFCALEGVWSGVPIMRTLEEAWDLFRLGPHPVGGQFTPFEGQKFPCQFFERSAYAWTPRWTGNDAIAAATLSEALGRIGKVHVIAHSSGCGAALKAAALCDNALSLILLEPAGLPDVPTLGGIPATTVWGDFLDHSAFWTNLRTSAHDQLQQCAPDFNEISFAAHGFPGHSHMFMQDHGNERALDLLRKDTPLAHFTG